MSRSTTTPAVIQLTDKAGGFHVLRRGNGTIAWTYGDKTHLSMVRAQ